MPKNNFDNNFVKPELVELSSGLKIILAPMRETQAVFVLVAVKAGSEYENEKNQGISHFVEHMFFKGTAKRPSPEKISVFLDGLGASYNASTSNEKTSYYIKIARNHLETAIDVVSDIYLNSLFRESDIEKEKGVIIEEINMYEDNPSSKIYDLFSDLLYGNQPAGRDILGTKETVKNLKRKDFLNYITKNYVAEKTIISIAGKFDKKEAIKILEKKFGKISRKPGKQKEKTIESQKSPKILIKNKKTDQAHLILGARAFDKHDERRFALSVLSVILGGGMSSRLWLSVREKMGAAYSIGSFNYLSSDHGYFAVAAGLNLNKTEKAIIEILKEFKNISHISPSQEEFQKAKDYLKGHLILGFETSDDFASLFAGQYFSYGRFFTLKEMLEFINNVKLEEISVLAKEIFQPKNLNLAIIGPFSKKNEKRFLDVLKSF